MKILCTAQAGTVESSDALVTVGPTEPGRGLDLKIESVVERQFGEQIRQVVSETLCSLGVDDAEVRINDRGALDCVISARVETAVRRAANAQYGEVRP